MGKKLKYSDDQLLSAIVKYADVTRNKIKATELAEWARLNVPGLEDVRDYHFTRPVRIKDEKTGKVSEKKRLCTIRLEEINDARSITSRIKTNTLLRSSNPYEFLELPQTAQRKLILETRAAFSELENNNFLSTRVIKELRYQLDEKNKEIELIHSLSDKLNELAHVQTQLRTQFSFFQRTFDAQKGAELYAKRGITYDKIDLAMKKADKLITGSFDINKELSKFYELEQSANSGTKDDSEEELRKMMIKGIFGTQEEE